MKITLDLPTDLVHALKQHAVRRLTTVHVVVTECLRLALDTPAPRCDDLPPLTPLAEISTNAMPRVDDSSNAPSGS